MNINQFIYNVGLILLALGLAGGIFAALLLARTGKRLRKQPELE